MENPSPEHTAAEPETFTKFFDDWLVEQNQLLDELVSVTRAPQRGTRSSQANDHQQAIQVVERVVQHYENYYQRKERWARHDILATLTPPWRSLLEDAFLWIGGWRPSMAFHLLYSKSGMQFDSGFLAYIQGVSSQNLGDISAEQLEDLDELQRETIKEEKMLTEEMAKKQETVADPSMVELSHAVSELLRNRNMANQDGGGSGGYSEHENAIVSVLAEKEAALELILKDADELRMRTLKDILHILTPMQAVHFLIAAAELQLRLHDWGKNKEAGLPITNQGSGHSSD